MGEETAGLVGDGLPAARQLIHVVVRGVGAAEPDSSSAMARPSSRTGALATGLGELADTPWAGDEIVGVVER